MSIVTDATQNQNGADLTLNWGVKTIVDLTLNWGVKIEVDLTLIGKSLIMKLMDPREA